MASLKCKNCGDLVDPRRVELGYDYCLKDECQQRCLEPVQLASIGINKAADYIMRADELLPPRAPDFGQPDAVADEQDPTLVSPRRPVRSRTKSRPPSTLERLRRLEAELDAALDERYQRFLAGQLTSRELDRERDGLIRAFNQEVMAENIRYRSMLRQPATSGGRPYRLRGRTR